jgi:lipopolysaccharide/colanic/teichoic acid biosynthesis glycosyltransferase
LARSGNTPTYETFLNFVPSFTIIIAVTVAIFYSYGLYDKPTLRLIRELNKRILTSQALAAFGAVILFYILPVLGIAPKTILLLYIAVSSILMAIWRRFAFYLVLHYKKQKSIIIGSGPTFVNLVDELSRNPHTGITLISVIDVDTYDLTRLKQVLQTTKPNSVIIDMRDERIKPHFDTLYTELFEGQAVLDIVDVYEDVFDMVPLELINQEWIFRYISTARRYDGMKRFLDLLLSIPLGIFTIVLCPFIFIAIKLEDGGPVFYHEAIRVGRHGKKFKMYKFRSMEHKPTNEVDETKQITRVGSFLRKTRLDEFPQVINLIRGDVSFVGPRAEAPSLVQEYAATVPFYNVRHVVRPGLSGWAQIHQYEAPKFGVDIEKTSTKLAYDLYYIEHSTLLLDMAIILKTMKVLLSRSGV